MTYRFSSRITAILLAALFGTGFAQNAFSETSESGPVRIAIVNYIRPAPNEEIVEASVRALEQQFGKNHIRVQHLSIEDLIKEICSGSVDIFLSSAGFYRRLANEGPRELASAVSRYYPDPNHGDGAAFVVAADRGDIQNLNDLRGKILVSSTPNAFTGLLLPYSELLKQKIDPYTFFSHTIYMGDSGRMEEAPRMLLSGDADVVFLRLCFLEEWLTRHPELHGRFKVINRKDAPGEVCLRSTDLYPSWTVAVTRHTDPDISRAAAQALLAMKPVTGRGLAWGVAADYSAVDRLFKETRSGPYEYLRTWTLRRFVEEYWHWILAAALLAAGLVLHSIRVSQLVKRRTAALSRALDKQKKLQKEAQDASARIAQLEHSGVVAQLSVIFAHEMRQPLGAISLYSFGLKRLLGKGVTDAGKLLPVLEKLDEQTERANGIVTRVRNYAKSKRPARIPVMFADIVRSAASDLKNTGRYRSLLTFEQKGNPVITADPLELELVALNLMKNALEASDQNDRTGKVTVQLSEENGKALLTVSDSGNGTAETVGRLNAVSGSTKTDGLGLSIVRGILEAYGGKLAFSAQESGGLTAAASIPLRQTDLNKTKEDFHAAQTR